MTPKLTKVIRLDSLPLNQTYFTPEGYLVDRPILTSVGIFEYHKPDGTVRRELRLPEEVFNPESLKSYKGRPIIITHDAGLVDNDNVKKHQIGTILSEGYQSGDDLRAEIIIHDTKAMKDAGLKELSLGYNLDLEETPGEWNGNPYDAIQRNIRINHLALVREARAGDQARLNIDSRDSSKISKGEKVMSENVKTKKTRRADGTLSPEDFAKAIEQYKARRAQRLAAKADEDEPVVEAVKPAADEAVVPPTEEKKEVAVADSEEKPVDEQVQMVKDRRDRRDQEGDPATLETAAGVIAKQDEDIGILFDIIDTLLAKEEFDAAGNEAAAAPAAEEPAKETAATTPDVEVKDGKACDEGPGPGAEDPKEPTAMNADSIDAVVRQRIQLGIIGERLNMDGLETMSIRAAKKAVILAVRPSVRLDGKSDAYLNAMFDCAVSDIKAKNVKDTSFQKKQMFNKDAREAAAADSADSSASARQRMIERQSNFKKEDK